MDIFTLSVGQGQFVVVAGESEAVIVDTYVPLAPDASVINVKSALAAILQGKLLVGLLVTGFDADHFNEVGMKIVLNKYRPNWIIYPKYFKSSLTANACFRAIDAFDTHKNIKRHSISLSANDTRFYYNLSNDFHFEVFSPHAADMSSSNNCSLVCKIAEKATGATYLVTGDTENDRWNSIVRIFGGNLAVNVLAAPHHGSRNGITIDALRQMSPHTVIISAGVRNQYGHPDSEAIRIFRTVAQEIYATNFEQGQSLRTTISSSGAVTTRLFE